MAKGQKQYTEEFKNTTITAEEYQAMLKKNKQLEEELEILKIYNNKKYRPESSKKRIEAKENALKRDFSATTINEKRVTDITYIHTIKDGCCYVTFVFFST